MRAARPVRPARGARAARASSVAVRPWRELAGRCPGCLRSAPDPANPGSERLTPAIGTPKLHVYGSRALRRRRGRLARRDPAASSPRRGRRRHSRLRPRARRARTRGQAAGRASGPPSSGASRNGRPTGRAHPPDHPATGTGGTSDGAGTALGSAGERPRAGHERAVRRRRATCVRTNPCHEGEKIPSHTTRSIPTHSARRARQNPAPTSGPWRGEGWPVREIRRCSGT